MFKPSFCFLQPFKCWYKHIIISIQCIVSCTFSFINSFFPGCFVVIEHDISARFENRKIVAIKSVPNLPNSCGDINACVTSKARKCASVVNYFNQFKCFGLRGSHFCFCLAIKKRQQHCGI